MTVDLLLEGDSSFQFYLFVRRLFQIYIRNAQYKKLQGQVNCIKFAAMGIIRKTKLVEALLELFKQGNNALSVVELVERFKGKANKTTIYRILDRLEDEGLVHSFKGRNGLTWYAKCFSDCSTTYHLSLIHISEPTRPY